MAATVVTYDGDLPAGSPGSGVLTMTGTAARSMDVDIAGATASASSAGPTDGL
ncbi:hypothetical protein [Sphingomonas adhaesiva]|uniref:hypothetical protein n=1 Tax=Sphingomonas adhaesiva TaxID=28212 RepID=UPI002FF652F3